MKSEEDEAFDDIAKRQGAWGGGYQAKRKAAADKMQEPAQEPYDQTALELCNVCGWKTLIPDDCCLNCERAQPAQETAQPAQETAQLAHIAQFMKELRPAIGPMATMGKSKTTQEWFDIVINEIERLQAAQEKNT